MLQYLDEGPGFCLHRRVLIGNVGGPFCRLGAVTGLRQRSVRSGPVTAHRNYHAELLLIGCAPPATLPASRFARPPDTD